MGSLSKVFISIFLSCISLYGVDWLTYDEARLLQEKNHKIIMIDAVRSSCHYCSDMDAEVFEDAQMMQYLEARFILVKVNLDNDSMPLSINPAFTPSFSFIDKHEKIIKTINGAWNIEDFKFLTKDIK